MRLTDPRADWYSRLRVEAKKAGLPDDTKLGFLSGKAIGVDTNANNRDVIVRATTDDVDLDSEVVLPEGVDMSYFASNKNVFLDHDTGFHNWVGKVRSITPYKVGGVVRGWDVRFSLCRTKVGDRILEEFREDPEHGAVSIGFGVTEAGPPSEDERKAYPGADTIIRGWRWVELSVTALPANAAARVVDADPAPMGKRFLFVEEADLIELSA